LRKLRWCLPILLVLFATAGPIGAQDISLPRQVPAYNQAYSEGPGAWGDCPLGTLGCPDLVCTTGCLVTAFSSVLAYYNVELQVPAASSCTGKFRTGMDPGIFNDWLRAQQGYGRCAQDPVGHCCLDWSRLPNEIAIETHVNRSEVGLNPVASVVIDHALRQGYPVIAGVHWGASCNGGTGQSEDCHWVILTGKRGNDYSIIDPYNANVSSPFGIETTLSAGVHGAYIIDRFVVIRGTLVSGSDFFVSVNVAAGLVRVGELLSFAVRTAERAAVLPFAQVTLPSGETRYASANGTGDVVTLVPSRTSLRPSPVLWSDGWEWSITHGEADVGKWAWELWIEAPEDPGVALDTHQVNYVVEAADRPPLGGTVLGVLLVVVLAAAAFLLALNPNP